MSKLLENYNKFGSVVHPNMDAEDMSSSWNSVSEEVKSNYSSISSSIEVLSVQKQLEQSLFSTYKTVKNTFDTMKETIEAASAVTQQQYQYPVLKIQEQVATELISNQSTVLDSLKSSIF